MTKDQLEACILLQVHCNYTFQNQLHCGPFCWLWTPQTVFCILRQKWLETKRWADEMMINMILSYNVSLYKPSAFKTISSLFHLHKTSANRELSVYLDGQRLPHECHPTYLGVTLDRTLSYREHLTKTAGKLKNRNNLLMKLAGSTWGASANTLWRFAIQQQSTALQSGHALLTQVRSMYSWTLPCVSSLVPSVLHLSHGFQCSPTLNRQPYGTKEGCHWQAGGENRQTWQLANTAWYPKPTIATTDIQEAAVAGLATSWHQKSMEA